MADRRFPPPWSVDDLEACFGAGQKLAYVYFEEDPGRRSAAKLLTRRGGLRRPLALLDNWFAWVFLAAPVHYDFALDRRTPAMPDDAAGRYSRWRIVA